MWDVVGEFITCPEVAYTQHYTTPFDEQNRNYWWVWVGQCIQATPVLAGYRAALRQHQVTRQLPACLLLKLLLGGP